jgi:hypothetical protein
LPSTPPADRGIGQWLRLGVAAVVTLALLAGWRFAEIQIVDRDPWDHWDVVWIVFALASILAVGGWIRFFMSVLRANRQSGNQ